jgi:hypothetical protein
MSMPASMKFKKPKGNDWFAEYAWCQMPAIEPSGLTTAPEQTEVKENSSAAANSEEVVAESVPKVSNLKARSASAKGGKVSFAGSDK